jgi:hypothetical protein
VTLCVTCGVWGKGSAKFIYQAPEGLGGKTKIDRCCNQEIIWRLPIWSQLSLCTWKDP